ncbi:facilitated trehalose transporter Tret1-like [Diabrotica undecimpunctata]|uniref:facilitated trehalose transporter Tret1-like n=1 Tax=Diabrotica undecimpunctata TaxID=50387 RepID=UPI003B638F64
MESNGLLHLIKDTYPQIIAAVSGTLFAISDGMTYGWSAPYIPYLISDISHIQTTKREAEFLETAFLLGSFCGLPFTVYLVDKIGRKKSLLLASFVVLVAWLAIGLGNQMVYIFVARFFCGMSGNMAFVAAPCFIAEIADSKIRGFLSSIIYVMMLLGCLIVYSVGPYLPFYVPCIIGGTVAIIEILVFSRVPESALYLLSKDRPEDALHSIKFYKPYVDPIKELEQISKSLEEQRHEKGRFLDLFLVPSNRKGILIMTVLNAGQHFCAYSVILMNLHLILENAGTNYMNSAHAAILFAALMLISVIFASFQIDKYGRKVLLLFSSILTAVCLLSIAVYFNLKIIGYNVISFSWIPIVSIMIYAVVFKLGVGIVPIVITAEIFPNNLKAIGMTLSDAMFITGGLVAVNLYQFMTEYIGIHVPFYIFGGFAVFITFYTIFFVPETKGKTLEEIQSILKGRNPNDMDIVGNGIIETNNAG